MKVNNTQENSTRSRILDILRNTGVPVSGELVAARIGVSRVAVWKGIQVLNANGYGIASSNSGYLLETDRTDSICPWEFGSDEALFRYWNETDSTMNRAREAALAGAGAGLVVAADGQSAGRGTGSKTWESPAGGLFFTLVTRPPFNAAYSHRQVLAVQIALSRSIAKITGRQALPLWPNDLLFDGGKAGGILAESLSSGSAISWLNLGIGLNTGTRPSLPLTRSIPAGRKALLAGFLAEFAKIETDGHGLAKAWNESCPLTGKAVRFRLSAEDTVAIRANLPCVPAVGHSGKHAGTRQAGTFRGVDEAGWAKIEMNDDNDLPVEKRFPPNSITILDKGYDT